jgi:hypothetical protein
VVEVRPSRSVTLAGRLLDRPKAGGHPWALIQWALGLQRLGVDAVFVESSGGSAPESVVRSVADTELADVTFALANGSCATPATVLSVMGESLGPAPRRDSLLVFIDIDPGYPQMWRELELADMFAGHDRFVTIGENIGRDDCLIPDCGLEWVTTPPPVVLDAWPVTRSGERFTTVGTWRNAYGSVTWNGRTYGSRVHEFRKFAELPRLVETEFELALDIDAAEVDDLALLERNGWHLVDPNRVADTPAAYRSYIQGSRAEFSVAQNMYVATRSGWLSDRSLCYLASGKPVLAQDTGFSDNYPVGEGLLAFSTLEEAAAGVDAIERNYEYHSQAARQLAEEYFDARKVLRRLLERLDIPVEASAR